MRDVKSQKKESLFLSRNWLQYVIYRTNISIWVIENYIKRGVYHYGTKEGAGTDFRGEDF